MEKRKVRAVGSKVLNKRYEILKVIHVSGMSNVYLVLDANLNKQWCLKEIVKSEAGKDNIELTSLLREANIMKGLSHPSIPRIVTIEEEDDSIFILMDYIEGKSIKEWVVINGRIRQDVVISWAEQICSTMMYLHSLDRPIFYRDMKPDNLLVQPDGQIKVLDFGISLVLEKRNMSYGRALGTKGYAAPEQRKKGGVCDLRSDVFAFGRTLYYMLTALNPHIMGDRLQPLEKLNLQISSGLQYVVNKCMCLDVEDRFQSFKEVLFALKNLDKYDEKFTVRLRKRIGILYVVGSLCLLSLGGSIVSFSAQRVLIKRQFNILYEEAKKSQTVQGYLSVLDENQKCQEIEVYLGYVDSLKTSGVVTLKDEEVFLNYLLPNLQYLEGKEGYGELAYELGRLYWFFYEDYREGVCLSGRWFSEAIAHGYMVDESMLFKGISDFNKSIVSKVATGEDGGLYKQCWKNLEKVDELTLELGEVVSLQISLVRLNLVNSYSHRLKSDGVPKEDIISVINKIKSYEESYTPSAGRPEDLNKQILLLLNTSISKINMAYGG